MKRLVLVAFALWLATLVIPGLGEAMQARAVQVWGWTGERLERPASPIANRYRRVQAENHLSKASRQLVLRRNAGYQPPAPQEISAFLVRHEITPDGLDPWGTPYQLVQEADSLAIVSAGPDLSFGTRDDVVIRLRFPSRAQSRGRTGY
jgi:hypothetical protein